MRRFLLRLYPAAWRARYGDEFEALLEERALTPFDVADVLLGAVDAHLHRRGRAASESRKGLTMSRHLGGNAAVVAGCLVLVSLAMNNLSQHLGSLLALAGTLALLVAIAGISTFRARQHSILSWAAFALPAVGAVVSWLGGVVAWFLADSPVNDLVWLMVGFGYMGIVAGSALFAVLTYRTEPPLRLPAATLALGAGLLLGGVVDIFMLEPWAGRGLAIFAGSLVFPFSWIALGWTAIRLDRRSAPTAAPAG